MNSRRALVLPLLGALLFTLTAFAADPPGRVARLDYMAGQVSIQPNGVNEWVAANINRPLTTSDRIWTDKDSRAELQMGAASARLNSETSLTLANVSDNVVQLQLDQGTLNLHVIRLGEGEIYEIDTPNVAFTVEKSGDYRFDVDNAGDTTVVTVWKGRGEATGDNPGIVIKGHQQMTFRRGRSLDYVSTNSPGFDGFDSWCQARAQREDNSPSLRYVSPYYVGYSDLDDYGYWDTVPTYGPVWVPSGVAVGWAPYRWGHWVYIAPWGWTWVDDAPWGFVPFHYGRWVYFGSHWGWCPGPIYSRPIWAPALVAWVGGSHWGFGLSFGIGGGVGWFPLGWGEPYVPWYGHSRNYFQNVNVTNTHITNITYITNNYYGNAHPVKPVQYVNYHPDRVTAVSNAVFTGSRPTRGGYVPVTAQAMSGAAVMNTVPVRPTRESVTGPGQQTTAPPAQVFSRPVVTKMTPPTPATPPAVVGIGRPQPNAGAPASNAPAVTNMGVPGRAPATNTAPVAGTAIDRPSRGYSRPPESTTPAIATEESPRGIPHPPSVETNRNVTPAPPAASTQLSMPSRVPRPPASLSQPINQPTSTQPTSAPMVQPSMPSRSYPRPTEGVAPSQPVSRPDVTDRPSRETPNSNVRQYSRPEVTPTPTPSSPPSAAPQTNIGRPSPSREVPSVPQPAQPIARPNVTPAPTPAPSVSHEDRPISRPAETHAPAQAAPQRQTEPSRDSHPDRKDNTASPKAGLRYPSPYSSGFATASVRQTSLTQSYPRPSVVQTAWERTPSSGVSRTRNPGWSPVQSTRSIGTSAPRVYSGNYASAPRASYSSATRMPSYSTSHYSSAPRYSSAGSGSHQSHSGPSISRSSAPSGSHSRR